MRWHSPETRAALVTEHHQRGGGPVTAELAAKYGVSRVTAWRWVNGKTQTRPRKPGRPVHNPERYAYKLLSVRARMFGLFRDEPRHHILQSLAWLAVHAENATSTTEIDAAVSRLLYHELKARGWHRINGRWLYEPWQECGYEPRHPRIPGPALAEAGLEPHEVAVLLAAFYEVSGDAARAATDVAITSLAALRWDNDEIARALELTRDEVAARREIIQATLRTMLLKRG